MKISKKRILPSYVHIGDNKAHANGQMVLAEHLNVIQEIISDIGANNRIRYKSIKASGVRYIRLKINKNSTNNCSTRAIKFFSSRKTKIVNYQLKSLNLVSVDYCTKIMKVIIEYLETDCVSAKKHKFIGSAMTVRDYFDTLFGVQRVLIENVMHVDENIYQRLYCPPLTMMSF